MTRTSRNSATVSARAAWGRGLATKAPRRSSVTGSSACGAKISARTSAGNFASQRVMRKCGLACREGLRLPDDVIPCRPESERAAVKYSSCALTGWSDGLEEALAARSALVPLVHAPCRSRRPGAQALDDLRAVAVLPSRAVSCSAARAAARALVEGVRRVVELAQHLEPDLLDGLRILRGHLDQPDGGSWSPTGSASPAPWLLVGPGEPLHGLVL